MSTHAYAGQDWLGSKVCPVCGKEFAVLHPNMWRFKYDNRKRVYYYCKYSCFMEAEKERDEMKKLTLEQKKKAVQIAVDGGNPLGYLEEIGIRNSAESWSKIKSNLKEFDPAMYAKLPKRLPQRERKAEEPKPAEKPKVELVYDPGIAEEYRREQEAKKEGTLADAIQGMTEAANQFFGACEDMGLKTEAPAKLKITKPVNYDGLDVTAVRHPEFGEFYHDTKYGYIDWRTGEGEEVSMTPDTWKKMVRELPRIMAVLGVDPE